LLDYIISVSEIYLYSMESPDSTFLFISFAIRLNLSMRGTS